MQDIEIINEVLNGNQHAFKQLVEKHNDVLFRTALGFVHNREDAEEIVQDSFVKAYRSLGMFAGKSSLSTWLYRIVVNQSINHLKTKKRKTFWTTMSEKFTGKSSNASPGEIVEQEEQDRMVRQAIEQLPEKQRIAFVFSKYEELPQKVIAEIMESSEGAVEQLIQRAKTNLRKKLTGHRNS